MLEKNIPIPDTGSFFECLDPILPFDTGGPYFETLLKNKTDENAQISYNVDNSASLRVFIFEMITVFL